MKDSRFIELLNLYVDHQISVADAALLEAEIQRNPARRKVYRQYCQMQKACVMLADNFRTEAPAGGKLAGLSPQRRRFAPMAYALGAVAAAAIVAFVLTTRTAVDSRDLTVAADTAPAVQVASQASPEVPASEPVVLPARVPLQPAFDGSLKSPAAISFASNDANAMPLAWIKNVQLQRVPVDELRFETHQTLQPQELMFRNSPRTFQGQTELTAWRFMK